MILKRVMGEAAGTPFVNPFSRNARRAVGFSFVFLFDMGKAVAGAVEMWESRRWRFPRAGGGGGKLDFHSASGGLVFHTNRGGTGDSSLHWRNSFALAAPIFFAHSVSLRLAACLSSWAKLIPALRHAPASGSDLSFSYGVA